MRWVFSAVLATGLFASECLVYHSVNRTPEIRSECIDSVIYQDGRIVTTSNCYCIESGEINFGDGGDK